MSRSGSRYPSAFGHTPSYRSYARLGSEPIGYSTSLNLGGSGPASAYSTGLTSDPLYTSGVYRPMALEASLGGSGLDSALSLARGPNTQVEYSKSSTYQSSSSGTGQVPRSSYASSNVTYSSAEPWKNNVSSYSYNI